MSQEEFDFSIIEKAARLVYCGLMDNLNLTGNQEYMELFRLYRRDQIFRNAVFRIAGGLHLNIISVDSTGIYLRPQSTSLFANTRTNLRSLTKDQKDKYMLLIFLGLAAYFFPRDTSFDEQNVHTTFPITINELDNFLRGICREIENKIKTKSHLAKDPLTELLVTSYLSLPTDDKIDSKSKSSATAMIKRGLNFLVNNKFFIKKDIEYWPTPKFYHHMESLSENDEIKHLINKLQEEN